MIGRSDYAPYAPPENIARILRRVRSHGLPARFDADYLRQLGIAEGNIQRDLRALEFLGLTTGGNPTRLAEQLQQAPENEWRSVLAATLQQAYRPIFQAADPRTHSRAEILDAFRTRRPVAQRGRMVVFFLGMCELAGLQPQEPPVSRPGRTPASRTASRPALARAERSPSYDGSLPFEEPAGATPAGATPSGAAGLSAPSALGYAAPAAVPVLPPGSLHPALAGIIAAVPSIETLDDLKRWLASFEATFIMVNMPQ
jgi:hypothetical protein